jgi:hypothetical protein
VLAERPHRIDAAIERIGLTLRQVQQQKGDRLAPLVRLVEGRTVVVAQRIGALDVLAERQPGLATVLGKPLSQRTGVRRRIDVGVVEIGGPQVLGRRRRAGRAEQQRAGADRNRELPQSRGPPFPLVRVLIHHPARDSVH